MYPTLVRWFHKRAELFSPSVHLDQNFKEKKCEEKEQIIKMVENLNIPLNVCIFVLKQFKIFSSVFNFKICRHHTTVINFYQSKYTQLS